MFIFSLTLANMTIAAPPESSIPGLGTSPITSVTGLVDVLKNVVKWIYIVFFILTVLFVLMAAFTYLTSAGDETKVEKAKNQIIYAAIAVAVALLAVGLESIVSTFLTSGQ